MKPLRQLDNLDRGKLLADLFPEERENILEAIKRIHGEWIEQEAEVRKDWKHGIISANFWYALADKVNRKVVSYGTELLKSNRRFADNLFNDYDALFTIDCIQKYLERKGGSEAFRKAVDMLFQYDYDPNK